MAEEVYMDIPQVQQMSKSFDTFGDILETIAKAMEAISMTLKATAFVGLVGGYAVAAYIDRIKPRVKTASDKMHELSGDLNGAVRAYESGDMSGSQRFV
ncbi:MAG: hypothetical protein P8046_13555 [Anaerolineales bacterium]|jgi:hypothetical protein